MTSANWYKHVNWLNTFLIVGIPLIGLVIALWTPLYWQTAVWSIAYYFATVRPSEMNSNIVVASRRKPCIDIIMIRVSGLRLGTIDCGLTPHTLRLHRFACGWLPLEEVQWRVR